MAYRINDINPLDIKNIGVGISLPFNGPGVFNTTYSTIDQAKSNIANFLLTNFNERIMNPDFGGNLRGLIFEQISEGSLEEARINIEQVLEREFPNIVVKEIKILGKPDNHQVYFSIKYSLLNNIDELSIAINE